MNKLSIRAQLVGVRATVNRERCVSRSRHLGHTVAQKQPLGEEKGVELVVAALAGVRPMGSMIQKWGNGSRLLRLLRYTQGRVTPDL